MQAQLVWDFTFQSNSFLPSLKSLTVILLFYILNRILDIISITVVGPDPAVPHRYHPPLPQPRQLLLPATDLPGSPEPGGPAGQPGAMEWSEARAGLGGMIAGLPR